mgnify:CR=1 FL=1
MHCDPKAFLLAFALPDCAADQSIAWSPSCLKRVSVSSVSEEWAPPWPAGCWMPASSWSFHDTSETAMAPLLARGAERASSPAAVASIARDRARQPADSLDCARGCSRQAMESSRAPRVKTFVDLSTTGPRVAIEVAQALSAKGIVSDRCACERWRHRCRERDARDHVCPVPRRCSEAWNPCCAQWEKVFLVGGRPGMGQTMKLANNLMSATALAITSEAMVMGVKAGLDPQVMLDVINAGSGRNSASQDKFPRSVPAAAPSTSVSPTSRAVQRREAVPGRGRGARGSDGGGKRRRPAPGRGESASGVRAPTSPPSSVVSKSGPAS